MGFNGFDILPRGASEAIRPWKVNIPQQDLDKLVTLLKVTPLAPPTFENSLPGQDRHMGVRRDWLLAAKHYWEADFDWRKHEKHINSFPHFKAPIHDSSGVFDIHLVALFSKRSDAIPILLLHGWPGCFAEFLSILEIIRTRYTAETLPYHLVVPSLPGYAFSSPPPLDRDIDSDDAARIFDALAVLLGFRNYMIQGGDLGGRIGRVVAAKYPSCKAIHLNTGPMPPPDLALIKSPINEKERDGLERHFFFKHNGSAYAWTHATRPSTIGFVLSSNPIALLAWVGEKYMDWTDEDPPLDVVLEFVTLYWVTNCAATSLWSYRQFYGPQAESHGTKRWHINKPLGYSWFAKEITPVPKAWIETTGDLVFYKQHDNGGHFAAMEQPLALWNDVEEFLIHIKDCFKEQTHGSP
ncbi:alpha/beta-hydrolase [Thozetella sp. PMI_491]|nr:alpha/beta-hydrolase [Thozetella sp. PMI_491]